MKIADVLKKFCELSDVDKEAQFFDYLDKLQKSFDPSDPTLRFIGITSPLEDIGGRLLGEFIKIQPLLEELQLISHGLLDEGAKFLIQGLSTTRENGSLRRLKLSDEDLSESVIQLLAHEVISHHQTLELLDLQGSGLTDQSINVLFSEVNDSHLVKIDLSVNKIKGQCFITYQTEWLKAYPYLSHFIITGNPIKEQFLEGLVALFDKRINLCIVSSFGEIKSLKYTSLEVAYILAFRKTIVSTFGVASDISTGLMEGKPPNSFFSNILRIMSNINIMGSGAAFNLLAHMNDSVNKHLLKKQMEHIDDLGTVYPEGVGVLADKLSCRLIKHLDLNNPVEDSVLKNVIDISEQMTAPLATSSDSLTLEDILQTEEMTFYQILGASLLKQVMPSLQAKSQSNNDQVVMEDRAIQDANMLLTAVAKRGVPKLDKACEERLFLYAFPLIAIVNNIYKKMLEIVYEQEKLSGANIALEELKTNQEKHQTFCAWLANSFHHYATKIVLWLDVDRNGLIDTIASSIQNDQHVVSYDDKKQETLEFSIKKSIKLFFPREEYYNLSINGMLFLKPLEKSKFMKNKPEKNSDVHISWSPKMYSPIKIDNIIKNITEKLSF